MTTVNPQGPEVLICGAGPTGLTLACELYRHGVSCRIIDKGAGPPAESRALGIHSRTLEIFEDMGVLAPVLRQSRKLHGFNGYADGKRILHVSMDELDAPYPFILSLPQSDTERALIERLEALGGTVEWETELTEFSQDADHVTATLRHPIREEERFQGWLIGCDGAHSAVRPGLGLDFAGHAFEERLALADVCLESALPFDEGHVFLSPDGMLLVLPMPGDGRVRLVAQLGEDDPDDFEPTVEWFRELLVSRGLGPDALLSDATWLSVFRVHQRQVERYRVGQVLLCGDAAHIHSPVGGQGMNTGIQDAYNLAWKLALVVKAQAPETLLSSYHAERHPIGKGVLFATGNAMRAVTLRHPVGQAIRNHLGSVLSSLEVVRDRMRRNASQVGLSYRDSPIVGQHRSAFSIDVLPDAESEAPGIGDYMDFGAGPQPGDRAPDVSYDTDARAFDLFAGTHHTLLLFDGAAATEAGYRTLEGITKTVSDRYGDRVQAHVVVPDAKRPAALGEDVSVVLDPEGFFHDRYGAGAECLYLVRPDGYVGFRSQPANGDALAEHLLGILTLKG
jgi:2-polyprenyl-6-methoxyphenol hydroxylase-like FAD-dependent oxidoreductase